MYGVPTVRTHYRVPYVSHSPPSRKRAFRYNDYRIGIRIYYRILISFALHLLAVAIIASFFDAYDGDVYCEMKIVFR